MFEGLQHNKLTLSEGFHRFANWNSAVQTIDQKDHFPPGAQESMSVLHSSHVYQELEKWPAVKKQQVETKRKILHRFSCKDGFTQINTGDFLSYCNFISECVS